MLRLLATLVLACSLAACGFHLRGSAADDIAVEPLTVEGFDSSHPLRRALSKQLGKKEGGDNLLQLQEERLEKRVLSYASDGTPVEYELRYSVRFQFTRNQGGKHVKNVSLSADYGFDPGLLLAKGSEEALLKEGLYQRTASKILLMLPYLH